MEALEKEIPELIVDHLDEGIILTNPRAEILFVNDHFTRTTGYDRDEVRGKNPKILSSGIHSEEFYKQMWERILHSGMWEGEIWNRRKNGELYLEGAQIRKIDNGKGQTRFFLAVFRDITEKKRLEEKIKQLTHYDPVTHLPNESFLPEIFHDLKNRKEAKKGLAVIHLSLLQLGEIIGAMGHRFGNRLLSSVAEQLKGLIGQEGILGRWNGAQFILLYPTSGRDEVLLFVQKLMGEFHRHFSLEHHDFYLTLLAGISYYPEDGEGPDTLFQRAEEASYCAREERSPYLFYSSQFEEKIKTKLAIRQYLRDSIKKKQLFLHYQPLINLRSRECTGAEALVRWNHPVLGPLSPGVFIPVAEEMGFIGLLDEEVIRMASMKMYEWIKALPSSFRMSVNLSVREFQEQNLLQVIDQILTESGLSGDRIDIEITESALMQDVEETIRKIYALRERGIHISIDDFGTGYSSLQYLRRLPVDRLKIDRSFIQTIGHDRRDQAIVKSVIEMGHSLGIKVLAEGIETPEQMQLIRNFDCDEGQGYFFSPPVPIDEMIQRCI